MKLGTKIILGFISTCFIFIVMSLAIVYALQRVSTGSQALEKEVMPAMEAANDIRYSVAIEALFGMDYTVSSNEESWKTVQKFHLQLNTLLEDLKREIAIGVTGERLEMVNAAAKVQSGYQEFSGLTSTLPEILTTTKSAAAEVAAAYGDFLAESTKFIETQRELMVKELANEESSSVILRRNSRITALGHIETYAAAYMINVLSSVWRSEASFLDKALEFGNKIGAAIEEMINDSQLEVDRQNLGRLKAIAATWPASVGKLKTALVKRNENAARSALVRDEVLVNARMLSEALNDMTTEVTSDAVNAVRQVMMTLVVGLALAITLSMVMAVVITRSITGPVSHILNSLSEGAGEVDGASGQLSAASNTLAEGATENAASLEETSAALEELSSMTNRNADNSVEANALMAQANEAVKKADLSMESVIKAMDEISVSGNEIGKIIKTIDEIAFQTNLLALNAAVEAARAGEAGAGFAVVADEVRNLAIRSAEAAKNTADLIAATINNINSGSEMVNVSAENFKTVANHSAKVAELLAEVAEASKEQSQGISQITTAMSQMDKVTQSNAASAEESASAAGQLSLQAGNLLNAVEAITALVHGGKGDGRRPGAAASPKTPAPVGGYRSPPAESRSLPMNGDDFDF
ncbi:MAG: methyl-accepting chemotaxis protein [Candidatus Adiutrix sp.]|jgi:methyl-accepting chemotaxis protein|nr:methyl-accepting chemotaxis protein [Candidatus Adiutrix sp.]